MMAFEFMHTYTHCAPLYQVYKYTPNKRLVPMIIHLNDER